MSDFQIKKTKHVPDRDKASVIRRGSLPATHATPPMTRSAKLAHARRLVEGQHGKVHEGQHDKARGGKHGERAAVIATLAVPNVDDYIFPMPSRAEIAGRGLPASYYDTIKKQRDELVMKFNTDPVFRDEVIAERDAYLRANQGRADGLEGA